MLQGTLGLLTAMGYFFFFFCGVIVTIIALNALIAIMGCTPPPKP